MLRGGDRGGGYNMRHQLKKSVNNMYDEREKRSYISQKDGPMYTYIQEQYQHSVVKCVQENWTSRQHTDPNSVTSRLFWNVSYHQLACLSY